MINKSLTKPFQVNQNGKEMAKIKGGDPPRVTRVLFEGEAQQGDLFAGNSVEETVDDPAGKPSSLVLIHVDHLKKKIKNKISATVTTQY